MLFAVGAGAKENAVEWSPRVCAHTDGNLFPRLGAGSACGDYVAPGAIMMERGQALEDSGRVERLGFYSATLDSSTTSW